MRLEKLHIKTRLKNLSDFVIDFSIKEGITVIEARHKSSEEWPEWTRTLHNAERLLRHIIIL